MVGPVAAARWGSAWWQALAGRSSAGVCGRGGIRLLACAPRQLGTAGLAAGARLSGYIGATVGEIGFLRGFWMDGSRRLAWLEDYAASVARGRSAGARRHCAGESAWNMFLSPIRARRGWCSTMCR